MSKWFLCQNEEVSGPFSAQQLGEHIESLEQADEALVWGMGQSTWSPAPKWLQQLQQQKLQGHPMDQDEDQQSKWYYSLPEENKKFGPLNFYDLQAELEKVKDLNKVFIWTKQMTDWQSFYSCSELLKKMNIRQQQVPRIPINGQVEIAADEKNIQASLHDLSLTGVGLEQCRDTLQVGQRVKLNIKSPDFESDLSVEATVRHTSEDRAGFEFENLSAANQNHIMNCFKAREAQSQEQDQGQDQDQAVVAEAA